MIVQPSISGVSSLGDILILQFRLMVECGDEWKSELVEGSLLLLVDFPLA